MSTNKKLLFSKWKTPEEKEAFGTRLASARRRKVMRLSAMQGYRCACCHEPMFLVEFDGPPSKQRPMKRYATLEHIKPQSLGGTDSYANTIATCGRCNSMRGTMDIMDFYHIVHNPDSIDRRKSGECKLSEMEVERHRQKTAKRAEKYKILAWNLACVFHVFPDFYRAMRDLYDHVFAQPQVMEEAA